jgi:hypothetical protein
MSNTDFAFDASALATMPIARLLAAFGLSVDGVTSATDRTIASRKSARSTPPVDAAMEATGVVDCIVLISAENNPLI